jgi:hypothetical protein
MLPHQQLLVRAYVHFTAGPGGTGQHESRFLIFREIGISARLIHRSAKQPARTGQTPALMANRGKHNTVARGRIPDELIRMAEKLSLALRRFQND